MEIIRKGFDMTTTTTRVSIPPEHLTLTDKRLNELLTDRPLRKEFPHLAQATEDWSAVLMLLFGCLVWVSVAAAWFWRWN